MERRTSARLRRYAPTGICGTLRLKYQAARSGFYFSLTPRFSGVLCSTENAPVAKARSGAGYMPVASIGFSRRLVHVDCPSHFSRSAGEHAAALERAPARDGN